MTGPLKGKEANTDGLLCAKHLAVCIILESGLLLAAVPATSGAVPGLADT